MSWFAYRTVLPLLFFLAVSACDDDTPTTPDPVPDPVTETFTGELTRNGAKTHAFTASASGTVTATLVRVTPDDLRIGMSLGTWNGAVCQIVLANDNAAQGTVVTGNITTVGGPLCVRLYDLGNLTAEASYEVQVQHP